MAGVVTSVPCSTEVQGQSWAGPRKTRILIEIAISVESIFEGIVNNMGNKGLPGHIDEVIVIQFI